MRTLIISGHFSPEVGYQEVNLAREFVKAGHTVLVLSTTSASDSVRKVVGKKYRPGTARVDGYELRRLKPFFRFRTILIPFGVRESIKSFAPDTAVILGVGKFMPLLGAAYKNLFAYRLVCIFADHHLHRTGRDGSLREVIKATLMKAGFSTLKKPWYRFSCTRSDRVAAVTPETEEILLSLFRSPKRHGVEEKLRSSSLCFDQDEFYFDLGERENLRRQYGIEPDDFVLVTATKLAPYKRIESILGALGSLRKTCSKLRMFLVGFTDDEYSEYLRREINNSELKRYVHSVSFASHSRLRSLYNAADLGLWLSPSITIQEAMGTGLPVLLKRSGIVSHLLDKENGYYYDSLEEIPEKLSLAYRESERIYSQGGAHGLLRAYLAEKNRRFCCRNVASDLVAGLEPIGRQVKSDDRPGGR